MKKDFQYIIYKHMKYIKLYEEFNHDEIYDVMMSICDTVSFKVSDRFPSTERVRIYETSEPVDFELRQYEEYLSGWTIRTDRTYVTGMEIVFVKGDFKEAGLSWLNEVYGNLKPKEEHGRIYYIDGENRPILYYYEKDQDTGSGYYWINYSRAWLFFESCLGLKHDDIEDLMTVWLASEPYNLTGLKPRWIDFGLLNELV